MTPKGFFGALFDFGFTTFITPKIATFVYILLTAVIGLGVLVFLIGGLVSGEAVIVVLTLIFAPIIGLVYLILARITLEFYVALIRMSEDIHHRLPRA